MGSAALRALAVEGIQSPSEDVVGDYSPFPSKAFFLIYLLLHSPRPIRSMFKRIHTLNFFNIERGYTSDGQLCTAAIEC